MSRIFCGVFALSAIITYCILEFLSMKRIKTLINKESIAIPSKPKQIEFKISVETKRRLLMDNLLTGKEVRNMTSDEQLFLSQSMVSDIAKNLPKHLQNRINAIDNDKEDAKHFAMDLVNGGRSVVLSFRGSNETDALNEDVIELKKAVAPHLGLHISAINVQCKKISHEQNGMRRLIEEEPFTDMVVSEKRFIRPFTETYAIKFQTKNLEFSGFDTSHISGGAIPVKNSAMLETQHLLFPSKTVDVFKPISEINLDDSEGLSRSQLS